MLVEDPGVKAYQSTCGKIPGTSYSEVVRIARQEHHKIQQKTPRRQPYIRSKYFAKDKIFVNIFWTHLNQKVVSDRIRRAKLYTCALDLIRHTRLDPDTIQNPNRGVEALHRFAGKTKDGQPFIVQIKENKKTDRKDFMSVFPEKIHK